LQSQVIIQVEGIRTWRSGAIIGKFVAFDLKTHLVLYTDIHAQTMTYLHKK